LGTGFGFGAEFFKIQRAAVFHGDAVRFGEFYVAAVGFEGAEDAGGDDGGGGFDDGEANAGAGRLQFAIAGARAFGKQNNRAAVEQAVQNGFQAGSAAAFAVDGDGIPFAQEPADAGVTKEGVAGEVINSTMNAGADERRVEKAGVVGGE